MILHTPSDMMPDRAPTVQQLLAFYLEAGVDCALTEEPVNRLSDPDIVSDLTQCPRLVRRRRPQRGHRPPRPGCARRAAPAPEAAILSAREAARTAPSLEALRALLEKFDGCALKSTATRLVFADGNPQARIMFVGEAPGREEDLEGLPFVGRSGKLLDRMIAAIGLDRSNAYIANVIPWRPPGNRTPTPQETQICLPFIQRQIELVNPDVLVTLGNPSTQTLLSTREGIMKTRGRWFDYDTGTRVIRALATFHPAYLLRSPSYKRMAWQDLRAIAKALEHEDVLILSVPTRCSVLTLLRRAGTRMCNRRISAHRRAHARRRRACAMHRSERVWLTAPSAARWPSRSATAAAGRSRATRTRAALPAPGRETAARYRPAACLTVSDARQTTTPPVSLNFASVSHGVRSGVASSNRCGRPASSAIRLASCVSPVTAAQRLVGAPLKAVAEETRDRGRRQRRRHFGAAGPGQKQRGRDHRERRARRRRPPRPSAAFADAADGPDRRSRRSRPVPTSAARCRRRPRRGRD